MIRMADIIAVMSPKGGVGKTFLASTLAISLSKLGHYVLLIDLNLYASNLSIYLGMKNLPTTMNDVIKFNVPPEKAIYKFKENLHVLPATTHVELEELNITMKFLRNFLFKLSSKYDYIIIDTEPGFTKNNDVIMRSVEKILLVSTPDIPTLMTTHKMVLMLKHKSISNLGLVLNKVMNAYYELKTREVEELMGVDVLERIPFDKSVMKFVSLRTPITKGRAFRRVMSLAKRISEEKGKGSIAMGENTGEKNRVKNKIFSFFRH